MSMKMLSIADVLELENRQDVMSVGGTVMKVADYNTGLGKDGGTAQNITVDDGTGEAVFRVWDHEQLTPEDVGAEIIVECVQNTQSQKWSGVCMDHYEGQRGLSKQVKVAGHAKLFVGGQEIPRGKKASAAPAQRGAAPRGRAPAAPAAPAGRAPQRPAPERPAPRAPQREQDPPSDDRPPHDDGDAPAGRRAEPEPPPAPVEPPKPLTKEELKALAKTAAIQAGKALFRCRNAHSLCLAAAVSECEWAAEKYKLAFTPEHVLSIAATFFIQGHRDGAFRNLSDAIPITESLPSLSLTPPPKAGAKPSDAAGTDGQPTA